MLLLGWISDIIILETIFRSLLAPGKLQGPKSVFYLHVKR